MALSAILPLKEMARLEFFDGNYKVNVDIQLYNGQMKKGAWAFAGTLTTGNYATEVPEKDFKKKLAAIPIAKPGMREFRLRQICLDYMKLQCQFPHKLSEEVKYTVGSQRLLRPLHAGIVHGGLPYVTVGSGNLYRMAEIYDEETGTIDAKSECIQVARLYGNACSGGAGTSWQRVINSANFAYTPTMTWGQGFIPVGPYTYSKEVMRFTKSKKNPDPVSDVREIIKKNGEQTMYESYAAMKPADGVTSCGHVRMNSAYPTVVRRKDGTIDPEQSYTLMTEQVCFTTRANHMRKTKGGEHYTAQGGVDVKFTFKELLDDTYLPFTFAEFTGEKPVEEGWVKLDADKAALSADDLAAATLSSNFSISDVFVSITDEAGNEVWKTVYRFSDFYIRKAECAKILPCEEMKSVKGARIRIDCQLYNGEKLTALDAEWKN